MLKSKHTNKYSIARFRRTINLFVCFLLFAAVGVFSYTRVYTPTRVEAAPSSTLNFQARLYNSSGDIVSDGNYHIEFKIYDSLAGGQSAQGSCVGGGTDDCLWVETRTTGNLVSVKNGYFSVNLGDVTPFPSINWDQDLHLTMNIGGSGGAASWDGEMSPRIKLTSVPYAFQANFARQLQIQDAGFTGTLGFTSPLTSNRSISLPDASGTVLLDSTLATTAFVQNGNSFGQTAVLGTNDAFGLQLETNGVTRLTIDATGNTALTGTLAVNGDQITSDGATLVVNAGGVVDIQDSLTVDSITLDAGDITLQNGETIANSTDGTIDITASTTATSGNLQVNGGSIGISTDTDLLQLANNALSVNGAGTFTGDLTVDGHIAVGSTASLNSDVLANFSEDITDLTTDQTGINTLLNINPGAGLAGNAFGQKIQVQIDSSNNESFATENIVGTSSIVSLLGSGDVFSGSGVTGGVIVGGSRNATLAFGLSGGVEINTTGTVGTASSILGAIVATSGTIADANAIVTSVNIDDADITDLVGANINTPVISGTGSVTNNYGVYINDQSGIGTALNYNLYSAGASSVNLFEGDLHVQGGISLFNNTVSSGTIEATQFCTGDGETNCVTDFSSLIGSANIWTDGGSYIYTTNGEVLGNAAAAGANKLQGLYLGDSAPLSFGTDNDVLYGFNNATSTLEVTTGNNLVNFNSDTLVVDGVNDRVGIGIANPSTQLHVVGSAATTEYIFAVQNTTAGGEIINAQNHLGNSVFAINTDGSGSGVLSLNGATGTPYLHVYNGSASYLDINQPFGIGRISPTGQLDVQVDDTQNRTALNVIQNDTTNNNVALNVDNAGTGNSLQINTDDFVVSGAGNISTSGTLAVNGGIVSSTSATLVINAAGSVDIQDGVTADSLTLDTGGLTIDGAVTDITTGTGQDLTVVANGVGVVDLNDFVRIGTLGSVTANSATVCRDAVTGLLTVCDANTTGTPFLQGGNSFGVAGDLGTNDAQALNIRTNGTTRLTVEADGDVSLASGNTLRIEGGTTATVSGIASPTAGMLFYDTDTNQLLTYNGTKWIADRGEYTIVAASDSSQAEKYAADYVADGTSDETEINTALTAAAGGKVLLLAGTYVADGTILVPNNTTLAGTGNGTVIQLNVGAGSDNLIENADQVTGTGVVIRDLKLDGSLGTGGNQDAIKVIGIGDQSTDTPGATISFVTVTAFQGDGIILDTAENSAITNNQLLAVGSDGIEIEASSYNTVTNNISNNNNSGVYINTNSTFNTVSGNSLTDNNNGIFINGSDFNTLTANSVSESNAYGIRLGNAENNLITNNTSHDNEGNNENNGIYLESSDRNTIVSNRITDTQCDTTCYAINITDTLSEDNYLADNYYTDSDVDDTSSINDLGTGTIYGGQLNSSGDYVVQPAGEIDLNGTATNVNSNLFVDGNTDEVQLTVQAHTTQTNDIFVVEASDGTNMFTVQGNGEVGVGDSSTDYKFEIQGTSGNGYFGITSSDLNTADIFGIDGSGNVRINTTGTADVATAKLYIVGNSQIEGVLRVGDGTNYLETNGSGQLRFFGNARNSVGVTLAPEFPGATLTGDGANNVGIMTSDFCSGSSFLNLPSVGNVCAASDEHNFYSWTADANNDYDVWLKWRVPSNFDSFDTTPVQFNAWSNSTNHTVTVTFYKGATACDTATVSNAGGWTMDSSIDPDTSCTINPNDELKIRVRLLIGTGGTSGTDFVRIGEMYINYLSRF